VSIFGVSLCFVLLTFETLLDVGGDFLFHLREREVPLDEFDCFCDSRVPLHWIVVMLFDTVLFLFWLDGELSLDNGKFFSVILEYSQHIPEVLDVGTEASVFVRFENAMLENLLTFHIVWSSAESVGSIVVFARSVYDSELVLTKEL
jgi:hypothetical protein